MVTTRPAGQSYIIKRPRLTKLLDESQARIILLCAPAGYGKTTLAREWIATRSEPVAWYRGGPEMLDVAAVAQSLATVLTSVGLSERSVDRILAIAARTSSPHALGQVLAAAVPSGRTSILVIDDYQHASGTQSEQLIARVVEETTLRIVVTSRTRPSWLTARMSVYGLASLIGPAELGFTDDEAREVLRWRDAPTVERVVSQAAGWPAVIGLAAQGATSAGLTRTRLPSELYDFIAEDLFGEVPYDLRRDLYLLALAGDAVDARTDNAQRKTRDQPCTEATGQGFLTRSPQGEIELHPLLRTFLLVKLGELPRPERETITVEALDYLQRSRRWDEVLYVLSEFPNSALAEAILEDAASELLETGRLTTIKRWLQLVPPTHANPLLLLARSEVALREGSNDEAQALAERVTELSLADELKARAHLAAARAAHLAGDDHGARRNAAKVRALKVPLDVHLSAQWLQFLQSFESQDGDAPAILAELEAVKGAGAEHALRLRQSRAFLELETDGAVTRALRELELTRPLLGAVSDPIARSSFWNLYSSARLYAGDYAGVVELTAQQLDEANSAGLSFAADHARTTRAAALIGCRQLGAARRLLESLKRSVSASSFVAVQVKLRLSRLHATMGDTDTACTLLESAAPPDIPLAMRGEWLATRALYEAALGRAEDAHVSIDAALSASRYIDAVHLAQLARAVLKVQSRTRRTAGNEITNTFRTLIGKGHADALVVACRVCPSMISLAARDKGVASNLVEILTASRDFDIARIAGLDMPRQQRVREHLSPREREVLELIAQGLTNREIAKALFISESTTKVHVRHILEKVGARSRTEAVRALRDD